MPYSSENPVNLRCRMTFPTLLTAWYRKLDPPQKQAARYELLVLSGWLMVFWAIGAASVSGYILTLFFCILAIAKVVKISIIKPHLLVAVAAE